MIPFHKDRPPGALRPDRAECLPDLPEEAEHHCVIWFFRLHGKQIRLPNAEVLHAKPLCVFAQHSKRSPARVHSRHSPAMGRKRNA